MKGGHNNLQWSFVKCVSSGTVILKGESTENKSTQQSWPTFVLEFFQRQHSLFSYAINCLNRLPVEFLMCYKFHVCFPQVDSTPAHCVRPCPVISAGLGKLQLKKSLLPSPLFSFLFLWAIVHRFVFVSLLIFLAQWYQSFTSALYISGLVLCTVEEFLCSFVFYSQSKCKSWRGSPSSVQRC